MILGFIGLGNTPKWVNEIKNGLMIDVSLTNSILIDSKSESEISPKNFRVR
jgi:hypothetical protein